MKKNLLQEAIAEAKQVRAACIENATRQLEENLTPSIKEMLAKKLEEELDLNEEVDEEQLEEAADSGFKEVKPKKAVNEEEKDDEAADEEPAAEDEAPADAEDAPADDAEEAPAEDDAPVDDEEAPADAEEEVADDDTPLKDITLGDLKQIISDLVAASAAPAPEGDLGADMEPGDVEGAGEEIPAGDMAATDAAEAPMDAEVPAADPMATDDAAEDEDEIDISEILRELEEEEKGNNKEDVCPECGKKNCICKENKANDIMPEDQTGKEHCKPVNDNGKDQDQEINELKKENAELKEGLAKCTKTLKDVNLLNSKLLYTTRLLKNNNLTESQKVNVIRTIDGARSAREVKALYGTLTEGIKGSSKNTILEGRKGSASRSAGTSTASTSTVDENMVRRFQELAGIIKE